MPEDFWNTRIQLQSYTFYNRRPQFVRTESAFSDWVLIGVESGAFDYDTGEERGRALPGDLIFAAPHRPLWRSAVAWPFTYHVLQWSFEPGEAPVWQAGMWRIADSERLFADYALLRPLHGDNSEFARRRVQNLLEDMLLLAWQARHAPAVVTDQAMREAALLLRERAAENFAMSEIANAVGLGPVQLTRRFRKAHGVTPIEYLTQRRLEIARRLLIETDASLGEIAAACGWSSAYYFSDVFKNAFGMAPGRFRKLHRV